ncbi:MAG: hypothetical protein L6R45_09500 [Anaerolineae bacterium]|nr:hypothetical protein [Anaerolineae bacterium]
MLTLSTHLARWLNVVLIIALLSSLLPPSSLVSAAATDKHSTTPAFSQALVETPKLAEIIETSPTANAPGQKDLTISKPAENPPTLPSSFIPHKQSQVGQWLYPMAVVNVGSSSIPQVTQFVSITPENVLGPEDNLGGGAKIYFACPGPPCDAGDFIQGIYDLGAIITLNSGTTVGGINVEAQTHSLSFADGGFNYVFPGVQVSLDSTGPGAIFLWAFLSALTLAVPNP